MQEMDTCRKLIVFRFDNSMHLSHVPTLSKNRTITTFGKRQHRTAMKEEVVRGMTLTLRRLREDQH